MYNVAQVTNEKCVAKKGCRLCIMYCPEANCLDLNSEKMVAEVNIERCKGCELCKVVCDAAKHEAIDMVEFRFCKGSRGIKPTKDKSS